MPPVNHHFQILYYHHANAELQAPHPEQYCTLMDDAYVALCLVEKVANAYLTAKGKKELPNDLSEANRIMRILIGEPHCSILDSTINSIFQGPQFQNAFNALLSMAAFNSRPFSNPPHPIWGNASVDEIVKVQMGAMGIF